MANGENKECVLSLAKLTHTLVNADKSVGFVVKVGQPLVFEAGDIVGLLGPSGCGKTTLLSVLGLLRRPSHIDEVGKFELYVPSAGSAERSRVDLREAWRRRDFSLIEQLRREHMGFALQSGELVKSLTVQENIEFPLLLNGWSRGDRLNRVLELINQFHLTRDRGQAADGSAKSMSLARSRINRLSGGEYQRVALARALSHRPSVIFVDEPTSALNRELANAALEVMKEMQVTRESPGITFMITHDEELAERFCNAVVRMAPRSGEPCGEVVDYSRR